MGLLAPTLPWVEALAHTTLGLGEHQKVVLMKMKRLRKKMKKMSCSWLVDDGSTDLKSKKEKRKKKHEDDELFLLLGLVDDER